MQSSWRMLLVCSLACTSSLFAAPIMFFAEDLNGDPFSRILFPNAAGARNSFLAQLPASSTDTLETLPVGVFASVPLTFSGISSTTLIAGNSAVRSLASDTDNFGEFPTSGNVYIAVDPNSLLTITFSSPVTSFGFYATDLGDTSTGGHPIISFTGAGGTVMQTIPDMLLTGTGNRANGSVSFFGYINTTASFTTVQISNIGDNFGFDDPVIGVARTTAATPEPASGLLFAAGLLIFSPRALRILKLRV